MRWPKGLADGQYIFENHAGTGQTKEVGRIVGKFIWRTIYRVSPLGYTETLNYQSALCARKAKAYDPDSPGRYPFPHFAYLLPVSICTP